MEELNIIIQVMSVTSVITMGALQVLKTFNINKKLLPLFSIILSLVISQLFALSFYPDQILYYTWGGFFSGLGASGFYDVTKKSIENFKGE